MKEAASTKAVSRKGEIECMYRQASMTQVHLALCFCTCILRWQIIYYAGKKNYCWLYQLEHLQLFVSIATGLRWIPVQFERCLCQCAV